MRQVIFKSIEITNFLSVGCPGIILQFQSGTTLITGENRDKGGRNGVGKSTIADALFWAIFGNTLREIKADKIIHNQSDQGAKVILYFDVFSGSKTDRYILTRTIEPNKVTLSCNDEDITRSSIPKTDALIQTLINASEEVFQNAVIMSANNTLPFMAQKKVEKRKFVEGILHLGVFGEMLLKIRNDFNNARKENDLLCHKLATEQRNVSSFKSQKTKEEESWRERVVSIETKISLNQEQIDSCLKEDPIPRLLDVDANINDMYDKEAKLSSKQEMVTDIINNLSSQFEVVTHQISEKHKTIKDINSKNGVCPSCKRAYSAEQDDAHSAELLKQAEHEVRILLQELDGHAKDLQTQKDKAQGIKGLFARVKNKLVEFNKEKNHLQNIDNQLIFLNSRALEYRGDLETLHEWTNPFDSMVVKSTEDAAVLEDQVSELQKKLNVLETAKYVVSEEGVKSYIVKKILTVLNSRLNFYLQALEAPCRCEFNELFEETILNDHGKEVSYFNFSGGERKRIDLAILFVFQDLLRLQTGTSFSVSFYDELIDSAVDQKGIEKIMNILNSRVEQYQENVYIVSHNKSALEVGFSQILLLEKHNGKTSIVS